MQAGFDAAVMQALPGTVPHAAFSRLRIRHISTLNYKFRARNDTETISNVNGEADPIQQAMRVRVLRLTGRIECEHWLCQLKGSE